MTKSSGRPDESGEDVFAELYEQYLPRVFRYISYRVGDVHLAEDLGAALIMLGGMLFDAVLFKAILPRKVQKFEGRLRIGLGWVF